MIVFLIGFLLFLLAALAMPIKPLAAVFAACSLWLAFEMIQRRSRW